MQNVTVRGSRVQSMHSNDSITVIQTITWDAPPNHRNNQRYLIKYQMQGQPTISETRTSSNATQATLELLVPRGQTSTYSVWVAAVSEAGQGEVSDRVDVSYSSKSTQQINVVYPCTHTAHAVQVLALLLCVRVEPDPPTAVNSVNSTCNSITITWSAPNYTGGVPLEGYAVRWNGRGSPLTTIKTDVTAVTITHLSPDTSYSVSGTAVNAIGEGEQSQLIMATTTSQGWCR